jgi:hypothetical protein
MLLKTLFRKSLFNVGLIKKIRFKVNWLFMMGKINYVCIFWGSLLRH